jgi:hypothetical protein
MIKYLLLITVLTQMMTSLSFAQSNNEVLGALFESQEVIKSTNIDPQFEVKTKEPKSESLKTNKTCTSNNQSSLPLRMVLGLLRGKGAKLIPSHDPNTGNLNIFGGPMIGNCNSMLDFVVAEPSGEIPYTFEVRVKGCGKDKCSYTAHSMNEGNVEESQIEVEPTMTGFVSCLEKTGVLKDGKIVKNKIMKKEFDVDKKGIDETANLVFASRGPAAVNTGGAIFSKKNLYKNDRCYYYEDIQKDGFNLYSQKSINHKKLMKKASTLCNDANYESIYSNLENFENIAGTYYSLEHVMQKDLLEKVKKAKAEMMDLLADEDKDLSDIDTKKYAQLFDDFYKLIVQKQFDDSSHNSADEENPNLLINLYQAYEVAESKEEKADLEKKIRDLSKKLSKYMEEPYFTPEDFKYFLSMKRKAPIKDPKWKQATLSLQKSLVSLRASCQAYNVDNSSCKFDDDIKDMMKIEDLNDIVSGYSKQIEKLYAKKEKVLKNNGEDESQFFAKKIKECNGLYNKSNKNKMLVRQYMPQFQMMAQQYCQQRNPYVSTYASMGGYYVKKYQNCIKDKVSEQTAKFYVSKTKLKLCDSMIDKYQAEYDGWSKLEKQRDEYYGSDDIEVDEVTSNEDGSYSFNYNPNPGQNPAQGQNQRPWMQQNPQQYFNPQQNQQQNNSGFPMWGMNNYSMMGMQNNGFGMNQQNGFNSGFNSGFGFNAGFGGNNSMYGRQPSFYGNSGNMYGGAMAGGMNMPGPMMNYMGNSSMAGGPMSFTYGT